MGPRGHRSPPRADFFRKRPTFAIPHYLRHFSEVRPPWALPLGPRGGASDVKRAPWRVLGNEVRNLRSPGSPRRYDKTRSRGWLAPQKARG